MAGALQRPCATTRCSGLVTSGKYCVKCLAERGGAVQQRSPSALGYDRRWRAYSESFRREFPLCGQRPPEAPTTDDSVCALEKRTTASNVTDHIEPVSGPDDPGFFDRGNHQALCHTCHNAKRQRERRHTAA